MKNWDQADKVSDRIIDILNEELENSNEPMQILVGQMLAFCSIAGTIPKNIAPQPFIDVMNAIQRCMNSIMDEN